jgi:hypothetical protein
MKALPSLALAAALVAALAGTAHAQVRITEVAPWSSGQAPISADWFELTNFGSTAVNLTGWKMDDDSYAAATAFALNGVTTLAAGASAVFIEGTAATAATFVSAWFPGGVPAGFQIGYYSGSGVGLGTGGDGVSVFDASNVLQAIVRFGASPTASPYATFDNAAGLDAGAPIFPVANMPITISTLSIAGVNGAFQTSYGTISAIGSPGSVAAVPEPETWAFLLAGLAASGGLARRRRTAA